MGKEKKLSNLQFPYISTPALFISQGHFQDQIRKYIKVLYKEKSIKLAIGSTTVFPTGDDPA